MIGVLLAEDGFGLDDLIRIGVVFGFLFLPAIKKLLASRVETGEEPEAGPTISKEQERSAAEQWKRLMRGEAPEPPELGGPGGPGGPAVLPESRGPLEPGESGEPYLDPVFRSELEPEPLFTPPREAAAQPEFKPLREVVPEPPLGPVHTPLSTLSTLGESHLGELGDRLPNLQSSGSLGSLGRASMPHAPPLGGASRKPARRARPDWRRAVVLSEVLALPLALRKDVPWMGRS